jgi:endonuclease-3
MALRSPSWARIAHGRSQNGTGCKHGLLSINLPVNMHAEDIHQVVRILKREVQRWPVPALAKYVETPFTVLISCILSLRTQDRTTLAASDRLFAIATQPRVMLAIPVREIEQAIYPVSFYRTKARTIHAICEQVLERYGGEVPSSLDELLSLPGVGRKTANIVVTLGFRKPGIAVDTHVHRISNRLGYVRTRTPDKTEMSLRRKLPHKYWIVFNDLLVAYGQNLCKPISPHCSTCKVEVYCKRVGVKKSR